MSSSIPHGTLAWIAPLVEREPRLEALALWAAELSPALRLQLSTAAERLANVAESLLGPFLLGARSVLIAHGPDGFARWWQLGSALASHPRASRAAEHYFTLAPSDFGPGGLAAAELWCELGLRVSERSRHLAAAYFAKTLPVLAAEGGSDRLREWVEANLALRERGGWQAQLIVEQSFAHAPSSVLATRAPAPWLELALTLATAVASQHIIAAVPSGLGLLGAEEQTRLFLAITASAKHDAAAAVQLYQTLPEMLALLTAERRDAFLNLFAALTSDEAPAARAVWPQAHAKRVPQKHVLAARVLADVEALSPWDEARGAGEALFTADTPPRSSAPVHDTGPRSEALRALAAGVTTLRASLQAVSPLQLMAAADALLPVARRYPEAAVAALWVLPELFRHAAMPHVARWVEQGLAIGAERPAAVNAYFSLASRSGRAALLAAGSGVRLEPELGVWRKLIEMASGEPAVIRRSTAALSLRPMLESDATLGEVELPELSDFLPEEDDNRAVLRFLALQLAGRRQFGTYTAQLPAASSQLAQLFLVAEGIRIQQRLGEAYPGTVDETQQLAGKLLEAWRSDPRTDLARLCDTLLVLALAQPTHAAPSSHALPAAHGGAGCAPSDPQPRAGGLPVDTQPAGCAAPSDEPARRWAGLAARQPQSPAWLPPALTREVLSCATSLRSPQATVLSSLMAAERLVACMSSTATWHELESVLAAPPTARDPSMPAALRADVTRGAQALSVSAGKLVSPSGAAQALGASEHAQDRSAELGTAAQSGEPQPGAGQALTVRSYQPQGVQSFVYDEWDHTIGDYRVRHCRVQELPLTADSGAFFDRTLREARDLLTDIKRQFEQLRPERYRPLFGLEDGEDFDLNALIDSRIEARMGRTPHTRIYTSRTRQARDVATLFLVDMSASTEQDSGTLPTRRIIDTLKETLVVMTAALEQLGDQYAIYGFSSRGRDRVEVYPVKAFHERLDHHVQARIGGIEPKSGTRMGAALRHMIPKFCAVNARSKHLLLLSDGFPQDHDYGADRRTHTYGIEDTAVALREASAAGVMPFCVTVDRAGNDYLRLMCDPAQYLIIDELRELPRELPKIYRRVASE